MLSACLVEACHKWAQFWNFKTSTLYVKRKLIPGVPNTNMRDTFQPGVPRFGSILVEEEALYLDLVTKDIAFGVDNDAVFLIAGADLHIICSHL